MQSYCVTKSEDHIVHKVGKCKNLPDFDNRIDFVAFSDIEAMRIAKTHYPRAVGCKYCMPKYRMK